MRFVLAIAAFVLAAVMIVLGIAQRTVLLEPASSTLSATVTGEPRYTVIEPSALAAAPGSQTVNISGSGTVFLAYGRSADIAAWIGTDTYASVSLIGGDTKLSTKLTESSAAVESTSDAPGQSKSVPGSDGAPSPVTTNPAGSDLWLEEFTREKSLTTTLSLPEGISVLVASDGTEPAPADIRLSWASDNATPWAGPLLAGGALMLLIGLVLYALALLHLRRSRRPRRNVPRGPRMPRLPRAPRPKAIKASQITGTRRMTKWVAPSMILVSGLALSGCSADFWPDFSSPATSTTATPTPTPTPKSTDSADTAAELPPPAVTVSQLENIMSGIAKVTTNADANLDAEAISSRFMGTALEQRLANYKVRAVDATVPALPPLPGSPLTLTLPQQTNSWPRVVMTVIQDQADATIAPTAVILKQESPRANYLVEYAFQLEPAAKVPSVAPALIGAPAIAPDNKLLLLPPDQVAAAYADLLQNGDASASAGLFASQVDGFRTEFEKSRTDRKAALPATASMEIATTAGSGETVALATNDSGSIVAVTVNETETVKPINEGATVSATGAASKALSGIDSTAKGILNVSSNQLLFYVPTAGSNDKVILLGFAHGLISSAELP